MIIGSRVDLIETALIESPVRELAERFTCWIRIPTVLPEARGGS